MSKEQHNFGLVHGAWHGAWCWELLQEELETLGHTTVAMDLPIDNAEADFDDYADTVVDALDGVEDVILVGHSRAGNVIPRAAGRLATKKLIYLCASFEPVTIGGPTDEEKDKVPPRNQTDFEQGIQPIGNDLYTYNEALGKKLFFSDCSLEVQEWAISKLRPQRRSVNEPVLEVWPTNIPQEYIICDEDLIVNPKWSHYAAKNWLDVEPVEFPAGHSPFLSRPRELAELLVNLASD